MFSNSVKYTSVDKFKNLFFLNNMASLKSDMSNYLASG